MGAFEYTRSTPPAASARASSKATPPATSASCCASRALLPVAVNEVASRRAAASLAAFGFGSRIADSAQPISRWSRASSRRWSAPALPLEEALLAVSQQTDKPRVRSVVLGVRARVMEGHTLADGLGDFPGSFPGDLSRNGRGRRAIRATSIRCSSGWPTTPRTAQELRSRTTGAMLYPVLLFVVCIAHRRASCSDFVVPEDRRRVFENSERVAAAPHADADRDSDFLRAWGIYLLIVDRRGAVWLHALAARRGQPRRAGIGSCCGCPLIGKVVRGNNAARFARTLQHADRQRGAGARGAAHLRRGRHQPADAPRGRRMRPCACAKAHRSAARSARAGCFRR